VPGTAVKVPLEDAALQLSTLMANRTSGRVCRPNE